MRISKKILAIALSILMAVSMMPFTVFAEDVPEGTTYSFTNTSGVTTYKTTAFPASFSSDGTYKLYQDATLTARMTLTIFTYNVTIDLNGHSITSTANDSSYPGTINMSRAGSATKHRSFSVINTSSTPATITNTVGDGVVIDGNYNDFTLGENVTMTTKGIGVWVDDHTNDTVTIDGDLVSTDYWGLYVNGTNAGPNTLTVNGSVIGDTAGIYAAGNADYIVNGEVTGDTGIYQKGGNLTVNEGAVVTGTGAAAAYVENGNGVYSTGDAIVVENNAGYNYGSTTINGGTITSTETGTSAISTPVASNVASASQEVQDRIDVDVKGGTFTEAGDPADVSEFVNENSDFDPATGVVTHYVAKIGDVKYDTFEAAWNAAQDGDTIVLVQDCAGNGLKAPQGKYTTGLTVDFNGKTYTIDGSLVGSTGTQSQAFQLLKDNTITFKNGTIYSEKARMLVQNYSNLTLDNMVLTLNNTTTAPATVYTLSNNNGTVVIDDTTINANPVNTAYAFDVCRYASYTGVDVTVTGDSVINGDVQIDIQNGDAKNGANLTLESGTMTGDIDLTAGAEAAIADAEENAGVTKAATFSQEAPEGYEWVAGETAGTQVLALDTHSVAEVNGQKYDTLEEALAAISTVTSATHSKADDPTYEYKTFVANGEVKLLQDIEDGNGIIIGSGSDLTIDFNGCTYNVAGHPVGSNGTETIGFQLLKDSDITFKNGAITTSDYMNVMRVIQNYADLTLDNMTISMQGAYYDEKTISTSNGDVTIVNSTINAPDYSWINPSYTDSSVFGGEALTVGTFSTYTEATVDVQNSTINGDISMDVDNPSTSTNTITLTSGTLNGDIKMLDNADADSVEVTKKDTFTQDPAEGYKWVSNDDGTSTLEKVEDTVSITTADQVNVNIYIEDTGVSAIRYTFNKTPGAEADTQQTVTVPVSELTKNADGQYEYSIVVAPAQIKDNITVEVIDNNNVVDRTYDTSVADYCEQIIDGNFTDDVKTLAQAVLDYGKAASAFFGYNTAAFTDDYNFGNFTFNTADFTASASGIAITEVRYVATSVPSLRFKVDMTEAEAAALTAETDKGYAAEFVKVDGDVILQVTGIPAAKLNETITISVSNGATIQYTPLVYAYMAAKSSNADLAKLGNAIGWYWQAANTVFA